MLAYRRRDEVWERLTFFGTVFLINFAIGVVTGIVQEFQFGMNWSNYSVFVGNIFGAPLAMEGLLAFFAEPTFIALWMFGRNEPGARPRTDARACSPGGVRALLAWSPEQPTLLPTSLRVNLRVGAMHATDRQITDLLRQLRLGRWLDRLEQGLDTVLAPWDHPVSGGELQRLSVARAVLADRPVLLLDEPTRHLGAATADAALQAVLERAADRSLQWITHRKEELAAFPEVHDLGTDLLSASDRPPHLWLRDPVPESAACRLGSLGQRGARR